MSSLVSITVRYASPNDARAILTVHHEAVHQLASTSYGNEILDDWSKPVTTGRIVAYQDQLRKGDEITLVAEVAGLIAGFAAIAPSTHELRAVYVRPQASRKGVGSALLSMLEEIAKDKGIPELTLDASLNAEPFYRQHGYLSQGQSHFVLQTGRKMPCVKMHKKLRLTQDQTKI